MKPEGACAKFDRERTVDCTRRSSRGWPVDALGRRCQADLVDQKART